MTSEPIQHLPKVHFVALLCGWPGGQNSSSGEARDLGNDHGDLRGPVVPLVPRGLPRAPRGPVQVCPARGPCPASKTVGQRCPWRGPPGPPAWSRVVLWGVAWLWDPWVEWSAAWSPGATPWSRAWSPVVPWKVAQLRKPWDDEVSTVVPRAPLVVPAVWLA